MKKISIYPLIYLILGILFVASVSAEQVHLNWGASSGVVDGYRIYYGNSSSDRSNNIDVGNVTDYIISNLSCEQNYYFVVRAYNQYGEGGPSPEVSWSCPNSTVGVQGQYTNTITVSSVTELENAVSSLQPDTKILIEDGVYPLTRTLYINGVQHVALVGASGNREGVVIKGPGMANKNFGNASIGVLVENVQDILIENLSVQDFYYHDIMIKQTQSPILRNLHLKDAGQQLIKVSAGQDASSYSDNGIIEKCLIEFTDRAKSWYTNGIDALAVKDWIVRDNVIRNILAPKGQLAGPAILFWQNSIDTVIERNRIINCDRGIAFGDSSGPGQYARDGETTYDHQGGIIRNNFIYRDQPGDVGISVNKAKDFKILNNTVILNNTFPWTIEYRFSSSNGIVANNLTDGPIQARDGAHATLVTNVTNAQASWFQDVSSGNLHLTSQASTALNHATSYLDVSDDIDGQSRGASPDIGADEFSGASSALPPPSSITATAANSIDLSWSSVSGAVGYNVYRSTTSGSGYVKINGSSPVSGTSYKDKNTVPGTTYYYVVTSVNSKGQESAYSKEAHATEPGGNQAPSLTSITAVPNPADNPRRNITFTVSASDSDGDPLSYNINFGDGTSSSSGSTVTHAYKSKGTYNVTATVSDNHGHSVSKTLQVVVNDNKPVKVTGVQAK